MILLGGGQRESRVDLAGLRLEPAVVRRVPRQLAVRYDILSIASDGNSLTIAMPDIDDEDAIDRVRLATGMHVQAVRAPREAIRRLLAHAYDELPHGSTPAPADRGDDAPAIGAVETMHHHAAVSSASDIHVEPASEGGRIRQRVDGILYDVMALPQGLFAQVVSRIKLLAGMDIADRRQPQDGSYTIESGGRSIDARVSSMPTIFGEKIAIRLLDHRVRIPTLENLGMPENYLSRYRRVVHAPHGFVVACGPTGSGKTTTLYATMVERNVDSQNLCSVEDPVEIRIPGIAQVQVNARAGLTFAAALRAFLRQDPNVLMVGEMRDAETAGVAVRAALSGQLVLTTLHTNDAPRTLERLLELGVQRQSIAAALTAVVSQRLVRRLCVDCRQWAALRRDVADEFGVRDLTHAYEAFGCPKCGGTGYRGRTAIFEFLFIGDAIRDAIAQGASSVQVAALAREEGYEPMAACGMRMVREGETGFDELRRVLLVEAPR